MKGKKLPKRIKTQETNLTSRPELKQSLLVITTVDHAGGWKRYPNAKIEGILEGTASAYARLARGNKSLDTFLGIL